MPIQRRWRATCLKSWGSSPLRLHSRGRRGEETKGSRSWGWPVVSPAAGAWRSSGACWSPVGTPSPTAGGVRPAVPRECCTGAPERCRTGVVSSRGWTCSTRNSSVIAPVEARLLDPQQRLLLETSWEALESSGVAAVRLQGSRTSVYAGIVTEDYREVVLAAGGEDSASPYRESGNSVATAIGRVAFTLGLEGPAVAVNTACSSSLVAMHQAVSALQRGETDLALAGGGERALVAGADRGAQEWRDAVAGRALQDLRRLGQRVRARRRLRGGGAEAAAGRGGGRGPHLGSDPRLRDQSRRRERWIDGAERTGAGARDRGSAGPGGTGALGGGLPGGPRHRDGVGGPHRGERRGCGLRRRPATRSVRCCWARSRPTSGTWRGPRGWRL